MLKKSVLFTLALLLLAPTLSARPKITMESISKALGNIEATYQMVGDLTASFSQKSYIVVLNKNVVNSGTFRWKKPGMFFIDYTGSQPKQYISNNKKLWIYVPGDTQVEVYKLSNSGIPKEALEFMQGFVDIRKHFNITGWKKTGSKVDLTLSPKSREVPYSRLQCHFRSDHLLDNVTIYNKTGNQTTYNFSGIQINTGISDKIFNFKKPKGVKTVSGNR